MLFRPLFSVVLLGNSDLAWFRLTEPQNCPDWQLSLEVLLINDQFIVGQKAALIVKKGRNGGRRSFQMVVPLPLLLCPAFPDLIFGAPYWLQVCTFPPHLQRINKSDAISKNSTQTPSINRMEHKRRSLNQGPHCGQFESDDEPRRPRVRFPECIHTICSRRDSFRNELPVRTNSRRLKNSYWVGRGKNGSWAQAINSRLSFIRVRKRSDCTLCLNTERCWSCVVGEGK